MKLLNESKTALDRQLERYFILSTRDIRISRNTDFKGRSTEIVETLDLGLSSKIFCLGLILDAPEYEIQHVLVF